LLKTGRGTEKEVILTNTKGWIFYDTPVTEASENSLSSWNEWRIFFCKLAQNLKNDYLFSKKSKALTKSYGAYEIPIQYDKPQIKAELEL
jgi:hypothetical protein